MSDPCRRALQGAAMEKFRDVHGDWGRDLVLYVGRRRCALKLRELGELAGGVDDATVGMAVRRFEQRLQRLRINVECGDLDP